MKLKHFLPLIAIVMGFGSCTNDLVDEVSPIMGNRDVISVSMENTRTAMEGTSVIWSDNDAIGIFIGATNNKYALATGAGTTSAEFQSSKLVRQATKEVAYFPHVSTAAWDSSAKTITTSLPATYEYAEGTNNNAVMAALMAEDAQSSISFQNAGALYAITVENIPAGYDKAVMTYLDNEDNVGIAGAATITFVDGVPTLAVSDATDAASAQKTITITFTGTGDKTFYFPMPVKASGYASKLQFSLQGEGKDEIKAPVFTQEPLRSNLYAVTLKLDAVSGGIVSEANDIDAANAALASDAVTSVAVKDATDTGAITIPAKSESAADVEHTIDLSKATLPNTGSVNIVVEQGAGEKATVEKLTVIVPEGTEAGSYNINAPGTTVTIQAANGTVIETIEAITAENTLIIGEGVTITNLNIKKGNVELYGNVENITSDDATTIKLMDDITLKNSMTFSKGDVTVDLNGKSIKCASSDVFVVTAGTLTINDKDDNSGLVYGSEDNSSSSCAVWAKENGTVIINGGTYNVGHDGASKTASKDNWRNDCIYARDNAKITINGGEFAYKGDIDTENFESDGNRFLLNCRNDDYKAGTCSITVTGGTFHNFNPAATASENPVANYVAAGYSSVAGENGTYVVKKGIFNEVALKAAIAAGKTEVTLGEDITLTDAITIDKDITLDLGGNTLSMVDNNLGKGNYAVVLVKKGNVVIKNGTIATAGTANHMKFGAVWAYGSEQATVTIKEGTTLKGNNWKTTALDGQNSCIATVYVSNPNCTITIEGGEFYCVQQEQPAGQNQILNIKEKEGNLMGDIVVKGGKFHRMNPEIGNGKLDGSYVAAGYSSVASGNDTYVVKGGIWNEAALNAAIVNGAEITLYADMTIAKAITIPTGITATINLNGFDVTAPNTDAFEVAGTLTIKDTNNEGVVSAGTGHPNASVCAVWANGGNVTIDGGHYKAYSDAAGNRNDCIYAGYNADNNNTAGNITINGGKFEYVWPGSKNSGDEYNGDKFLLNCADKDLNQTLITVNGGQFKNNAPSYEPITPAGRPDSEVQLGSGKKVYNGDTEVTAAHTGTTDIWYQVK